MSHDGLIAPASEQLPEERTSASSSSEAPSLADFEPVVVESRHDGWTPEKQRAFIEELADCGIVKEAAARVGMTAQSARRLRRRPDAAGFSLAWDAAVEIGTEELHSLAYERAVLGTVRRHYFRGKMVGEDRVFDNRLLIYLLGRSSERRAAVSMQSRIANWDRWMDAVEDGLPAPMPEPNEDARAPVWWDESGQWLTNFPPPDDFNGTQSGDGEDYWRQLTPGELNAIADWEAGEQDEESRRRDRYFSRLRCVSTPR